MIKRSILVVLFFAIFADADPQLKDSVKSISRERLEAHVRFLSHDLLEGRGTGTRGFDLAALYVASQFEQLGLVPGGTRGSFFQEVPFRKTEIVPEQCSFQIYSPSLELNLAYAEHYLMPADYSRPETSVNAEMVFVGHGVTAPEIPYDDYAGIDVKGKIVVILSGAPGTFPASERAHYSSTSTKGKNAIAHGAIGIIGVQNPEDEARSPWDRSIRQNKLSGYRWTDSNGIPHDADPQILGTAYLSHKGAEEIFRHSPKTLEQIFLMWRGKELRSFPLGVSASLKKVSRLSDAVSSNVIGMMKGSDPELSKEYVVQTAHLDHLGISEPVQGDSINNGAYDNATGIACLIEMARALTSLKVPPQRSTLFIALTGEEKGLQGADYFVHNPTVPLESIAANVNTDMFLMLYPFKDAVALGAEHSTLGPVADRALRQVGLKRTPDPAPEEVRFVRSDQYPFIKKGIPAIKLGPGFESENGVDGAKVTRNWLRTIYHSPQDENSQTMHWESGLKIVQATFLIGYEAANAAVRPTWNPGDFFGRTFAGNK